MTFAPRSLILSALASGLAALAVQSPASAQTVTLRVAHTAAQVEPYQTGFEKFREEVEKATGGAISDEGSVLKSIQSGSIAMATVANATIADFAQEMHIFDLPFLFKDRSQAYHVLDGEIGQSVGKALADKGFVLLGYYEAGVRNVLNNQKPITSLTDFKGMKIRVIPSSINIDTFRALGANPVPLNYSELYTALQTHVVDGAEAANSNYNAKKFYEVAPHYALVRWQILVAPVVISKRVFEKLTPDQQAAVKMALQASLTEPDRGPWIEAVKPVWQKWAPVVGQKTIDAIAATQ